MEELEFKPMTLIKIVLSVVWIGFMIGLNGVHFTWMLRLFVLLITTLIVFGWFKYPYPFNIVLQYMAEREKRKNDTERQDKTSTTEDQR